MSSKRFNNLPKKTKDLPAEVIEKLLTEVKKKLYNKIRWVNWLKLPS